MNAPTAADLAAIPLLSSLAPNELREAAPLFAVRRYPKNAIVATEGDRLDLFNIVLSGKIQFFWRDEGGSELKLGVDGPGGHFVDATLGGEPVLISVIAVEDLRVASIPMKEFEQFLMRHPQVLWSLLMDVVARHRRLLKETKALGMEDVYGRVVWLLQARAVETSGKLVIEHMTHADIAQRVGATREMVGRVLRDLIRGGYIEADQGRLTILRQPPRHW
jgi:CRP/FNR family transcriptional regulator, cyclic AMP receptor protein